ncbi:unnamed protein product [Protopolystoma xenopodis]|uniref:Uncharacterized protein n=1 Tax=Protopolystoma xenopodis TaxID=117903 RepID=A0A3S5FCH5_9PLAT|nr:unnamed protein product [Protopolystoma xenopodis]
MVVQETHRQPEYEGAEDLGHGASTGRMNPLDSSTFRGPEEHSRSTLHLVERSSRLGPACCSVSPTPGFARPRLNPA